MKVKTHFTICPICGPKARARIVYRENISLEDIDPNVFSARRTPDRLHYQMMRCESCALLRANPVLDDEELISLYERSQFTYDTEASYAGATYRYYLERTLPLAPDEENLLEIGCGSGFFLKEAQESGIQSVVGIEPSHHALEKASAEIRDKIVQGVFRPGMFSAGQFSLVTCFQVLDHFADPVTILKEVQRVLKPGGLALFICHDVGFPLARILGQRWPIVDIEHPILYDRRTLSLLFSHCGMKPIKVFSVKNRYPLAYWIKLMPFPSWLKVVAQNLLTKSGLGRLPLSLYAGNMGIVARNS